jgi:hypothetical protein
VRNSLTDFAIVVILGIGIFLAFRREDESEDHGWEARWQDLAPTDRTRIMAAARSGTLLADPDEIELAAGFARRDRRLLAVYNLAAAASVAAGAAFMVAGIVADSLVFVIGGGVFLLRGLWGFYLDLEAARNFREAISRDHRP